VARREKGPEEVKPQAVVPAEEPQLPRIDRETQARIGSQLRSMYDELAKEPIPDHLLDLLRKLGDGDPPKTS
jgi:hypothetical protein